MGRLLNSKLFSVGLLAVFAWLLLSSIDLIDRDRSVREEVRNLEQKIVSVEEDNAELEKQVGYLENPAFLEREARLRLNYKAPDEVVVFVYPDDSPQRSSKSFYEDLAKMENYKKWLYWLMGD